MTLKSLTLIRHMGEWSTTALDTTPSSIEWKIEEKKD